MNCRGLKAAAIHKIKKASANAKANIHFSNIEVSNVERLFYFFEPCSSETVSL